MDGGQQPGAKIPVEFLGLARQFVRNVAVEDAPLIAATDKFAKAVDKCGRRGFRQPVLKDVFRQWQHDAPRRYRIEHSHDLRSGQLEIFEARFFTQSSLKSSWAEDGWEAGVCFVEVKLCNHGKLAVEFKTAALIGLHALARWFQRTGLRDEVLLVRDLVPCGAVVMAQTTDKQVECDRGKWLGRTDYVNWNDGTRELTFMARTFVESGGL